MSFIKDPSKLASLSIGLVLLSGALLLGREAQDGPIRDATSDRSVKAVRVASVLAADGDSTVRFPGVVVAVREATLSFPVRARLVTRSVDVGDSVRKGQRLATLDTQQLRHQLAGAEASVSEISERLDQLRRDQGRVQNLLAAKAATSEEVEKISSAVESQEASLRAGESRRNDVQRLLAESTLVAPYAAVVTRTLAEAGEMVQPGQPVIQLSGDGDLEVQVGVPESFLERLQVGSEAVVQFPLVKHQETGRLESIGRAALAGSGLYPVKVSLPASPSLSAGMTAEVLLVDPRESQLTVPLAAVLNPGGQKPSVLRLDGNRVQRLSIEVGSLFGDRIGVSGDLAEGHKVVVTGHTALLDGDHVEVLP